MSGYDITIVGAGPAGSVLALLAARARYRVLLVEKSQFDKPRFGETAPPELRQALTRVGLENLAQAPFCRDAPEVLYQPAVVLTRLGFPNQLQHDSRWQTEGRLPWGLPLRYGRTIPAKSFAGWQAE